MITQYLPDSVNYPLGLTGSLNLVQSGKLPAPPTLTTPSDPKSGAGVWNLGMWLLGLCRFTDNVSKITYASVLRTGGLRRVTYVLSMSYRHTRRIDDPKRLEEVAHVADIGHD